MVRVNIHEAKTHLSQLLERVEGGEEIVIARAGKPIAEITPVVGAADRNPDVEETPPQTALRPIGLAEGLFLETPDFDAPLAEELLRLFKG